MKRQLLWLLLAFAAAGCSQKHTEVRMERKTLTSAVYASGSIVPEEEYKVVSAVDGYLVSAKVKEGDVVRQGQLLFTISNEVRTAQESGARAVVARTIPTVADNAPALRDLEGRIELARIKLHEDSLQYARYKKLYDQDAIAKSNYEKYYLQYQGSLKEYQSLQQQYRQQGLAGDIQLQQARNQLAVSQAQSDIGNLKSFVDGTIYEIYKKEGDLITPNQPIALIGKGQMIARLLIDEDDLNKITIDKKVLITMDAFPDKVFKAHIVKVYPLLSKVEQSFRADAVLDDALPVKMYGLNVEANIVIAENQPVMAIPKSALLKDDSVMVKRNGNMQKVKIRKGIEDENWVEVLGGIDTSAIIIVE